MAVPEFSLPQRLVVAIVHAVQRVAFRIGVDGADRIPATGGAVIASNHVSPLDGVILAVVIWVHARRAARFVTAAEFFRPPFGVVLRAFGQIPIRRGEGDTGALTAAIERATSGSIVGIFPEGRVNPEPDGPLQPGRTGVARIALAAAVPVVPLGIHGTQRRWPRGGLRWRRPARIGVGCSFGEPVRLGGDASSQDEIRRATDDVLAVIAERVAVARSLAPD